MTVAFRTFMLSAAMTALACENAGAQVLRAPQPGNQLSVSVAATVSLTNGVYTYSYTVTSAPSSAQNIWFITIALAGDAGNSITNPKSPNGWLFIKHPNGPMVNWGATQVSTVPANFNDDGSVLPSPYQIVPGQKLSGFSFQSSAPPSAVSAYVQGFTKLPQTVDAGDLSTAGYRTVDFTDNSIVALTEGPSPTSYSVQPSGAGFFSFTSLVNQQVTKSPITVGVHFDLSLGTVETGSLHASLNGVDITSLFAMSGKGPDLVARLDVGSTPLVPGANFLEGIVSATPNGAASPIVDMSRTKFFVNTLRSGDLNGDGEINCADMAIIKAALGKKLGEPGFDPRADVNGDGVVSILDRAAEARLMPGSPEQGQRDRGAIEGAEAQDRGRAGGAEGGRDDDLLCLSVNPLATNPDQQSTGKNHSRDPNTNSSGRGIP
jgi:dockerin type I repeat protein